MTNTTKKTADASALTHDSLHSVVTGAIVTRDDFLAVAAGLREAALAYYAGDGSIVLDDASYDIGVRNLAEARKSHPDWDEADDLLFVVAGGVGTGDIPHSVPMLSLDNAMDDAEMEEFFARVAKLSGEKVDHLEWALDPKLDGMALSLHYVKGRLSRAVTRGNGLSGEDVTTHAQHSAGVLAELGVALDVEIRGECVMTHDDFAKANEARVAHGKLPFANPRNAVAGTLRSIHRQYAVPTSFFCYGVVVQGEEAQALGAMTYSETMEYAEGLGFTPARQLLGDAARARGVKATLLAVNSVEAKRSEFGVDTDGVVIKADSARVREMAGNGSRAPRWAIARKFAPDTRESELLDIVVEVGRTGNLSFTAKIAPVSVGGATISSATVHNVGQIEAKGLRLPGPDGVCQRVWVRRAGEVIPEIVGPVTTSTEGTLPFVAPSACPRCGGALDTTSLVWRCVRGRVCGVEEGLIYAVGRDQLDIDGCGPEVIRGLVANGALYDVSGLFTLTMDDLTKVDRLGEKNATKILAGIDAARELPLSRVYCALGIKLTGRSMSRRLAKHFGTLERLRGASVEELCDVEGVGPERAKSIVAETALLSDTFDALVRQGVGLEEVVSTASAAPFAGKTVVVTGSVPGMTRTQAQANVEFLGGKSSSSLSKSTTLLVAGEGAGSKLAKAESLGVEVMDAATFAELVAAASA